MSVLDARRDETTSPEATRRHMQRSCAALRCGLVTLYYYCFVLYDSNDSQCTLQKITHEYEHKCSTHMRRHCIVSGARRSDRIGSAAAAREL